MAQTLFDTSKGDIPFPGLSPGGIDAMPIGATTPGAGTFTALKSTGLAAQSIATGLTAGTTHTLVGALALTKQVNIVTTAAVSADAVALPSATAALVGTDVVIFNQGANPIAVWPQVGDAIDGGTAGVAVVLTNAKRCRYFCTAANTWLSSQMGVASA